MLRIFLIMVSCLLEVAAKAATIQIYPQESAKNFAARYAPNDASEVRVGWVERSDTHRSSSLELLGIATFNPSYRLLVTSHS